MCTLRRLMVMGVREVTVAFLKGMRKGHVKHRTLGEDGLWRWEKVELGVSRGAVEVGDERRLVQRASTWRVSGGVAPRGFDVRVVGGDVLSFIADDSAEAWVRAINSDMDDVESVSTVAIEQRSTDARRADADKITALERRCQALDAAANDAQASADTLSASAAEAQAAARRAEARAQHLEDRVVALTVRLSAADDRADAAQEQLARAEAQHFDLRRRFEDAAHDAQRYRAACEALERELRAMEALLDTHGLAGHASRSRRRRLANADAPQASTAVKTREPPPTLRQQYPVKPRRAPQPNAALQLAVGTTANRRPGTVSAAAKKRPPSSKAPRQASTSELITSVVDKRTKTKAKKPPAAHPPPPPPPPPSRLRPGAHSAASSSRKKLPLRRR